MRKLQGVIPRNLSAVVVLRRGADVRDAWIAHADRYGVIVVTPQFDSVAYKGGANYNVGRVMTGGNLIVTASH